MAASSSADAAAAAALLLPGQPELAARLVGRQPALWLNPSAVGHPDEAPVLRLGAEELAAAADEWAQLSPLLAALFDGVARIESPLVALSSYSAWRPNGGVGEEEGGEGGGAAQPLPLSPPPLHTPPQLLKLDSELPICGSVKARGGLFEVLTHAVRVAAAAGVGIPALASSPAARAAALAGHCVAVGSTGNLGLSVGIGAAALGLRAAVHMSVDAKAWKKALLRSRARAPAAAASP